jgi:anti-sigma factor RsiW
MNEHPEHPDFAALNDYVDGTLDPSGMSSIDKHLSGCTECTAELASLRALVAATGALPKSVLPEDDIWADLKAAIDDRKGLVLPTTSADVPGRARTSRWRRPAWLAAAAVVLVTLSSATTAIVLRSSPETRVGNYQPDSGTTPGFGLGAPPGLPASFRAAEGQYMQTIQELRDAVDAQRDHLNPETVRTVDHSLAVVDSAIAEAREALLADPNNRTLVDLLSASYQRKLDLLRRTSELSSRI